MKYRKLLALVVVVFAVGLTVPGCGKKGEKKTEPGGPATWNGFTTGTGYGQGSVLSLNTCYAVARAADGTVRFPIATDPANPHYVYGGQLYATAYVANAVFPAGNTYSVQNAYGDNLTIYISPDDRYFSGTVTLAAATVRDIQRYVGKTADYNSLCVDGVVFYGSVIQGSRIEGGMTLYVKDYPAIN